jgi:outer membrane lipopolysaccharide assembly protein LptE/RlpB
MRTILRLRRCLLAALLLTLSGCGQRLNYETTVQLGDGEVQSLSIDPPKREQKVSVTVTSSGSPIDAYIVLDKDKEAAKQALLDRKKPANPLDGKTKTQDATLEATIPANTGFAVLLGEASKSSQVKVKVSGR